MTRKDDEDISAQVSSRLEELFGADACEGEEAACPVQSGQGPESGREDREGGRETPPRQSQETAPESEDSPLKDLKALVFGIDWEISDEAMDGFLKEVNQLQKRYANNKILSTFLKLHESVGKYIKAKKARSHPEAIRLVSSVFTSLEKVLMTPDMPREQKKELLTEEVRKFKAFKEQVIPRRKPPGPEAAQPVESAPTPEPAPAEPAATEAGEQGRTRPASVLENQEAVDYIVAELKKTIKKEFRILQQIIKSLSA